MYFQLPIVSNASGLSSDYTYSQRS